MKPKVLSHDHLNDDYIYKECELAKSGIRKIQFLSIPLIANSICMVLLTFNVVLSKVLCFILGFTYLLILVAYYYQRLDRKSNSLFSEFSIKLKHHNNYFSTPEFPLNPPLCKGYLYAKKQDEEYSNPYSMNVNIIEIGKDVGFNTLYHFYVEIANYTWSGKGYSNTEFNHFKVQCLKDFEKLGYLVESIIDEYGTYLWIKGNDFQRTKIDKYISICRLVLFKIFIIASILTPFLYIAKDIVWINKL